MLNYEVFRMKEQLAQSQSVVFIQYSTRIECWAWELIDRVDSLFRIHTDDRQIANDLREFTDFIKNLRKFAFTKPLQRRIARRFRWDVGVVKFDQKMRSNDQSGTLIDPVNLLNSDEILFDLWAERLTVWRSPVRSSKQYR